MRTWVKILLGIVAIFVLLVFAGAVYEVQKENEIKNTKTAQYTVVNFWSAHHAGLKRYAENILTQTTDRDQIILIAKKEILKLKEDYGADVVWLNIGNEVWQDNPKMLKKEIARATWVKSDAEPKPSIDPNAEKIGYFAGGELWILWEY